MLRGELFLGVATLLSIGMFFHGRRYARITVNPLAGRRMLGLPIRGAEMPVAQLRLLGWAFMLFAPIFWLMFAAVSFGLFPSSDIIPIRFN